MGTSSARKAPVGKFWRTAKTVASRFASGKEASPPQVQEVVARYLTALNSLDPDAEAGGEALLPDIIRTAASLGDFYHHWQQDGWEAALESLGLNPAPFQTGLEIIPTLLDKLAGPGARLDQAVARAALIHHLGPVLSAPEPSARSEKSTGMDWPDPLAGVQNFLALAIVTKLHSDLGETLEFHASTLNRGYELQEQLKSYILANLQTLATPENSLPTFSLLRTAGLLDHIITRLGGRHEP